MKYIIEEIYTIDEINIKIVMSRCEMFEIIEMLNKINRKLQKMQGVEEHGNSKK